MHQHHLLRCIALTILGAAQVIMSGCGSNEASRDGVANGRRDAKGSRPDWETPTDEECLAFAEDIERLIEDGDAAGLSAKMDWDTLLHRAIGDIEGADEAREAFIAGTKKALRKNQGLAGQLVRNVSDGGSYQLLRVHTRRGQKRALFRLLVPDGAGVNYHDWLLVKQSDGRIRGIDMFIFGAAERLSKVFRRGFLPVAADSSRSFLDKLGNTENEFVEHAAEYHELVMASQSGQAERVLEIYRDLPESMQQNKNMLLLRFHAAVRLGPLEQQAAIDDLRKYHPNDPCIDILSIECHVNAGDYEDALACVDRLDRAAGGDPYLDVLRANVIWAEGDIDAARDLANRALDADESFIDAYWILVNASLEEEQYDKTVELLDLIRTKFQLEFEDLTQIPEYAGFVKSPQYQEWIESRERP